jgi:protein TonB
VTNPQLKPTRTARSSIADVVFAGEPGGRRMRLSACLASVLALYGAGIALSASLGAPVANWSAEMAARVHDAISKERVVDMTPPPPPAPLPPEPPAPVATHVPRAIRAQGPARPAPSDPARAGKLTAVANDPADFTGAAFVVGGAATFPGGTTAPSGAGTGPGTGKGAATTAAIATADGTGRDRAPNRARAVSLDQAAWSCPWPAEADAEQVDERTVVLRVTVRADGRADEIDIISDPGLGFGPAARACARVAHFEPARNADGQPIAAVSAPIRVHFFR